MTPVLKKNKDRQNPANYRGITVTKIFTKIIQSIFKSRVDIQIDQIQNPLQRGFTEAIPMLFAAFIASEVIIESSTNNDALLLLTLDAEKFSISSIMKSFSTNYTIMVLKATCGYYCEICTEK